MTERVQKFTQAERETIVTLAARGLSAGQIARKIGRAGSASGVYYHMLEAGYVGRRQQKRPDSYQRNGYPVRCFSKAEDRFIEAKSMEGLTHVDIGRLCKVHGSERKPNSIRARLNQLAAWADRAEIEANEGSGAS